MKIYNFTTPLNVKNTNYSLKNKNSLTTLSLGSNVSFSGVSEEQKKANAYNERFLSIICSKNFTYKQDYKKSLKSFFKDLNNEGFGVQKRFLEKKQKDFEKPFLQSLILGCEDAAVELVKLYKKADEKTITKFLIPDSFSDSPFMLAVQLDSTLKVANELRELLKKLSPENLGEFFYRSCYDLDFSTTIIDELRLNGNFVFVRALEADKALFDINHPELAEKLRKKYSRKNIEKPIEVNKKDLDKKTTELNNGNVDKKVAETKSNSNFRIYENVKTRLSDVGGMFNVKKQIKEELLNILNNPNVKNVDKPSGIILYGPPGTGKTLLATAIAGEAGVPFISTAGSGFNEIYVGAGAKHVRELYATARDLAHNHPSKTAMVFIDEADAVASKRGMSSSKESDHTLNALLTELDGVQSKEENDIKIITILATNRKDMFDDAFRKGRVDLEFKIDDPRLSEKARKEILEINAKDKPFKNNEEKQKIIKNLAQTSSGMSGAELADVIKRAYRKTLYLGRTIPYITEEDITEAKLEAIIGIKNDSEKSEFEQKSVLAHEAGHAINLLVMNRIYANENEKSKLPIQKLDFIVNESRGDAAGLTMMKPSPDNNRLTVESLMSSLVVKYGGYSIEEELFDGHTDGVSSDLETGTNLILNSVTKWGLGSKTKFIGCSPDGLSFELFKSDIKQDILDYSNKAMNISSDISKFVKPFIEEYTNKFFDADTDKINIITGEKFEELFDEWLSRNGNNADFKNLCADIKESIANFKKRIKSI